MAEAKGGLNPLQQLIAEWLDGEPGRKLADLSRRAQFTSRNTLPALFNRANPREMPDRDTLVRLARGLELPYRTVVDAAVAAVYGVERMDVEGNPRLQALVALGEQAEAAGGAPALEEIVDITRTVAKRYLDEPGR